MKILIVEDSRAAALYLAERLGTLGHEIEVAGDGQEGVERFRAMAPDLVFMDIEMPVMNGFEATHQIRAFEATQAPAWTPIIFLTASDTAENLVTAIDAGGDDFMAKGVPDAVLQARMKSMARIAKLRRSLAAANRRLEMLASQDGLTGLANRRQLDRLTDAAWSDAVANRASFALLMLDVDHFKQYNDHYGHPAGDEVLRAFGAAIASTVDTANAEGLTHDAFAARYGGEEFTVIIPRADLRSYVLVAEHLLECARRLAIPHRYNAGWDIATMSMGGTRIAVAEGTLATLFRTADDRLYVAKGAGRNRAQLE